jgi:DNA-binding winged helix-turn-helix (wHTH) protein
MRIRFGDFVLDTDRRELLRGSTPVHLSPKAFTFLEILVDQRPKAVSQEALFDRLWPDTIVEKTNVHNVVYQLREALGDSEQAIIRTVYGFGFSFAAAAVEDEPRAAAWQILIGDREFDLHDGENIVGRGRDSAIRIDAPSISRRHARITVSPDGVSLEDLGSKNGTFLSDRRIHSVKRLNVGDRILFGDVAATLCVVSSPSTESVF